MFGLIRRKKVDKAINARIEEVKRLNKAGLMSDMSAAMTVANFKGLKKDLNY